MLKLTSSHQAQIQEISNILGDQAPEILAAFFAIYSAQVMNKVEGRPGFENAWSQVVEGVEFLSTQLTGLSRTRRTA